MASAGQTQPGMPGGGCPDGLGRWQARLVYAWVAVLVLGFAVTAIANLDTGKSLSHVSGAWIAQSHWATQGVYYPPIEDDGVYAGTRFGPLAIALQAGAHALLNDPVIGAKLLHAVYMAALIAGLWVLLGPLELARPTRLLLATAPLATWIGWTAGLTVRHDALAAALQVWALAIIYRKNGPTARGVALAAVVAGLAILAKLSGMWGAAACFFYLLLVAPKRLLILVPVGLVTVGLGLMLAEHFSDGRFFENMRQCLFMQNTQTKADDLHPVLETAKRFAAMVINEPLILLMMALSAAGAWVGRRRAPHIAVSCVLVWLMSAYLLTNSGVDSNHLIDLVAVSCLGTGLWLASTARPGGVSSDNASPDNASPGRLRCAAVSALIVLSVSAVVLPDSHTGPWLRRPGQVADAAGGLIGTHPNHSAQYWVRQTLRPGDKVIVAYNPMVPVLAGEDPVVADSWVLCQYFNEHPEREALLLKRIERKQIDAFVFGLGVGKQLKFHPQHFGENVLAAIREHYELDALNQADAYTVFRPKPEAESGTDR